MLDEQSDDLFGIPEIRDKDGIWNCQPKVPPGLRIVLWKTGARLPFLPPEFNLRSKDARQENIDAPEFPQEAFGPRLLHRHGIDPEDWGKYALEI